VTPEKMSSPIADLMRIMGVTYCLLLQRRLDALSTELASPMPLLSSGKIGAQILTIRITSLRGTAYNSATRRSIMPYLPKAERAHSRMPGF
jgi:hypothetical protein